MSPRVLLAGTLTSAFLLAGLPLLTAANETFAANGHSVSFADVSGNEWWVQAHLSGNDVGSVSKVEAMQTGGPWMNLAKQSYGDWAASFHVAPGNQIRFRATWVDSTQISSCWFAHPSGVEQCPPAPAAWQANPVGHAGIGAGSGDVAIGDANDDGRPDVTTATRNGVYNFQWTGTAWSGGLVDPDHAATYAVTVGDADNDGHSEIYTMSNREVLRMFWFNGGWDTLVLATVPEPFPADMTIGDIDGQPGKELYVGASDGSNSSVYRLSGSYPPTIDRIAHMTGHLESLWIGDGDRDGAYELYIGHGTNHAAKASRLRFVGGTWELYNIDGAGSQYGEAHVVAGDGDRDGQPEIYMVTDQGEFRRISFHPATGWNVQTPYFRLPAGSAPAIAPSGLFLGDGDGDGSQELYVTTSYGQAIQIRWNGATWDVREIARLRDANGNTGDAALLATGDGDGRLEAAGDAMALRSELYLEVSYSTGIPPDEGHSEVYQILAARPTNFAATFTGVRGNEWWQQVNTAATGGTLARVDVRLNGGNWLVLTKQSWGAWAASYRAVQGTVVQFRAVSSAGASVLSACYQWIPPSNQDAAQVSCTNPPPPGFEASFTDVRGNEWWEQAQVTPNSGHTVSHVELRVNGGAWQPLKLQSWGVRVWAGSYHAAQGAKVQFRATDTAGTAVLSECFGWIPPSDGGAVPVAC